MYGHPCVSMAQIKFKAINASSNGDNTLVAAVAGKKIRVLSYVLNMVGTAVTHVFQSGASGTALTGTMNMTQNSYVVSPFSPVGLFETAAGSLLNLSLSGAQSVQGFLLYQEV